MNEHFDVFYDSFVLMNLPNQPSTTVSRWLRLQFSYHLPIFTTPWMMCFTVVKMLVLLEMSILHQPQSECGYQTAGTLPPPLQVYKVLLPC